MPPPKNNKADKASTIGGYGITDAEPKLGYTPVRQGGGIGQSTNMVEIGWSSPASVDGYALKATIDNVHDCGYFVFATALTKRPITAGFAANPGYYTKDPFNKVLVTIAADKSTDISYNDTVGYLPAGFYPAGDVFDDVECLNASGSPNGRCSVVVRGGPIYVLSVPAGTRMLRGSIPYDL